MFSRTLRPGKGRAIWNVRAMPRLARTCGAWPEMSSPLKRIVPSVGVSKPDINPNKVVLPAPFGPIRPVMRPASASSEAESTASRPPKRLLAFST